MDIHFNKVNATQLLFALLLRYLIKAFAFLVVNLINFNSNRDAFQAVLQATLNSEILATNAILSV